ncbi:MAG TPA: ferric reductase-like transmembrane domain-containing protein [Acidimicrobiales bacterium]|nr:ferric reductase-like transmembrane domain-containing protein [Acidimicrobiales bacterium]
MTSILANSQLWWYTARSSGVVAWLMLTAGVFVGLALSTRAFGARPRANWLLDFHRFLGGAAVVFTGLHLLSLVLDSFVTFGPAELFVPFVSSYRPSAVAWGVVALYLLVAVEATSLLRKRLSKRAWRATHMLSFPLFVLASVHAITAGTDSNTPLLRATVFGCAAAVAALTAVRVSQVEERAALPDRAQRALRLSLEDRPNG